MESYKRHHNEVSYHDNIRDSLEFRVNTVRTDSKGNFLSLSVYAENYYREFLSILLDCNLKNANESHQNVPGIDLLDSDRHIAAQVSVVCDSKRIRKKIQDSIEKFEKFDKPLGERWKFYYVPITKHSPSLKKEIEHSEDIEFDWHKDILDVARIMEMVQFAGIEKQRKLSNLVDHYDKEESNWQALKIFLSKLMLRTWRNHPSFRLMHTSQIDPLLYPEVINKQYDGILKNSVRSEQENPVWSIIRETWENEENQSVVIQGSGGIGKTVALFSLTLLENDFTIAPAVYVPMYELVDNDGKIRTLSDYFLALSVPYGASICNLASQSWEHGPKLLVLLDGFNEVPSSRRWDVLRMLNNWKTANPGAQYIAVSRPMDTLNLGADLIGPTLTVELSPLNSDAITEYLNRFHVVPPEKGTAIWNTIEYPLFLNLYVESNHLRNQHAWQGYPLFVREPIGPGSIIWNYLQRELLIHENEAWIIQCAIACEHILPYIAFRMISEHRYTISHAHTLDLIDQAINDLDLNHLPYHLSEIIKTYKRFHHRIWQPIATISEEWYNVVLRDSGALVLSGGEKNNTDAEEDETYAFLHQNFRDCLAGIYLANQAEIMRDNSIPRDWKQSIDPIAIEYTAELISKESFSMLWDACRLTKPIVRTSVYNLLELCMARAKKTTSEESAVLNFSGMDLRGMSLTRYMGDSDSNLKLFQDPATTVDTLMDRDVFEGSGHSQRIRDLLVLQGRYCVSIEDPDLFALQKNTSAFIWDLNSGQRIASLSGHTGHITCIATLSHSRCVTGSVDCTLRIWDTATATCKCVLCGHTAPILCVALLPNGDLISGSSDKTLRIWDVSNGRCKRVLKGHTGIVNCVTILSRRLCASGSGDSTIRIWDYVSGKCIRVLDGHTKAVTCISVLPEIGFVSGSEDLCIRIWNLSKAECRVINSNHLESVSKITVLPNGQFISMGGAVLADDYLLRIWDSKTGKCLHVLQGHTGKITCMALLADNRCISGSWDETLRIWDTATGQCIHVLNNAKKHFTSIAAFEDGACVCGTTDGSIGMWAPQDKHLCQFIESGGKKEINAISALSDGIIMSATGDRDYRSKKTYIHFWDYKEGKTINAFTVKSRVECICVLTNNRCVIATNDGVLNLVDYKRGTQLGRLIGHTGNITSLIALSNEKMLSGSMDATLRLWDITTGECLNILQGHTGGISSVVLLTDNKCASCSLQDHTIRIWDYSAGLCINTIDTPSKTFDGIAALPDGRLISITCDVGIGGWPGESTCQIWDSETGMLLKDLGHVIGSNPFIALPNGLCAGVQPSPYGDWTILVWDPDTVSEIPNVKVLCGHKSIIFGLLALSDGHIVSCSADGTIRLWDVQSEECELVLEETEIDVSHLDISFANIPNDLAELLCQNGATIPNGQIDSQDLSSKRTAPTDDADIFDTLYPSLAEFFREIL